VQELSAFLPPHLSRTPFAASVDNIQWQCVRVRECAKEEKADRRERRTRAGSRAQGKNQHTAAFPSSTGVPRGHSTASAVNNADNNRRRRQLPRRAHAGFRPRTKGDREMEWR